ncbi:MAG: M48 family metalloprotease, partial [Bradyrhizobium sp.]
DQRLPVAAKMSSQGSYGTVAAALDLLQEALNRGDTRLDIVRAGARSTILIHPVPGCIVRTQLVTSSRLNAFADDRYASVSTAIARFASDDAELAFIVGHELAHGFLRHQALLSDRHRSRSVFGRDEASSSLVLKTEKEADYVALYMMARAGFDLGRIPDFLRRYGKASGAILQFVKDHPSSRERVAAAEATIVEIRGKQARGEPLMPSLPRFVAEAAAPP